MVLTALIAFGILSRAQDPFETWSRGEVRRVVSTNSQRNEVSAWRSPEGIEGFILVSQAGSDKEPPEATSKALDFLDSGTRVALLQVKKCKVGNDGTSRNYYKVRILSGPLENRVCYILKAFSSVEYLVGEPALAVGGKEVAGAFDDYTLDNFHEANRIGDDRMVETYLSLDRVFLLPQFTRLVIKDGLSEKGNVRARVSSGKYKDKVLYFRPMDIQISYPTVSKKSGSSQLKPYLSMVAKGEKLTTWYLGKVKAPSLLYFSPSPQSKPVSHVSKGQELLCRPFNTKWLAIAYAKGKPIYVSSSSISIEHDSATGKPVRYLTNGISLWNPD